MGLHHGLSPLLVTYPCNSRSRIDASSVKNSGGHVASKLEELAFVFLRERIPGFYVPSLKERKQVLTWLGMSSKFVRSFDALQLNVENFEDASGLADFSLIEIKVTEKELPRLNDDPHGVFLWDD